MYGRKIVKIVSLYHTPVMEIVQPGSKTNGHKDGYTLINLQWVKIEQIYSGLLSRK